LNCRNKKDKTHSFATQRHLFWQIDKIDFYFIMFSLGEKVIQHRLQNVQSKYRTMLKVAPCNNELWLTLLPVTH